MHRRTFLQYVLALGAIHALPTWCRTTLAADRPALPIPNLLQADAAGKVLLRIQQGQTIFKGKPAKTFGYNSNLLGPALKFRQDQQVTIALQNGLNVIAVDAFWQEIVFGLLVIVAIVLNADKSCRDVIVK